MHITMTDEAFEERAYSDKLSEGMA